MTAAPTLLDRARSYAARVPGAISGQGGHDRTFSLTSALIHGFLLGENDALAILREWNATCRPPWSELDLRHKVHSCCKSHPRKPRGWLLGEYRATLPGTPEAKRAKWPTFETPTAAELRLISELRNVSAAGLLVAVARGLLFSGTYRNTRCWLITDSSRRVAQARRLDGGPFVRDDGTRVKALTLAGSIASLPVGLPEAESFHHVMLVEGGPDLLAAFHFIAAESRKHDSTAICMLGATQRIAESALPALNGKRVRIFRHVDLMGWCGAAHWARSILPIAEIVDGFDFSLFHQVGGGPVKDLNDLCFVDPDEFEESRPTWSICPG